MNARHAALVFMTLTLTACVTQPIDFKATQLVNQKTYLAKKETNGVVLLDVNWGRWWRCGNYENAQLVSLAFDKLPIVTSSADAKPSLVLQSPSRLMVDSVFTNYAYSLEPGEYALRAFSIKVADSISKVGFLTADQSTLFQGTVPLGGTFTVKPGEAVYIGNFFLDCTYGPTLWRYYSDGKKAFNEQVNEYRHSFPFLDLKNVVFRLFKTKRFGKDYELEK